jgi:REP element-mobilizing transposase RayT
MDLSSIGRYADACWKEIPTHHKNVGLDEFIVMPNHVHGIIEISGPASMPKMRMKNQAREPQLLASVQPKASSLGAAIRSYKAALSYWASVQGVEFEWQPRFQDRIIRGKNSLSNIRRYIQENPMNWEKDTEFVRDSFET